MKMREKSRENHSGSQALAGNRKALFLTILALAWPTLLEQMLQTLVPVSYTHLTLPTNSRV